ncbi:MAG: hypothetical protein ACI37T_02345 [Candidatus Gastranaerophilaceae bacterium]
MKNNINNFPCLIELNDKFFECDFDHKSIDILETITGLGFYEIYEKFVFKNNLSAKNTINLIAVAAYKKHGSYGLAKVKALLLSEPTLDLDDLATLKAHFKNLLPDMINFRKELKSLNSNYKSVNNNSLFYDFEGSYAVAKNFLGWSDTEFWNATPKKMCFALISLCKYNKELEKIQEQKQTENCLNFLNGIKKMI